MITWTGYIHGIKQFFFQMSVIDAYDKTIIASHISLTAKATDAVRVIKNAVQKRNLGKSWGLVVRSDNGPQFRARVFRKRWKS